MRAACLAHLIPLDFIDTMFSELQIMKIEGDGEKINENTEEQIKAGEEKRTTKRMKRRRRRITTNLSRLWRLWRRKITTSFQFCFTCH
jgi:hypothetical protein